jgi:hypothetical protein
LLYFFAGIDEFNLDGQVVGEVENVGGMEAMLGSEAGYAFEYGCAGDSIMEEKVEEAGIDRDAVVFCRIAQVNSDFESFAGGQHSLSFRCRSRLGPD